MDLIKAQELPTGVVVNYHKVENVDETNGKITVFSFVSQEAYLAGKPPVTGKDYFAPLATPEQIIPADPNVPDSVEQIIPAVPSTFDEEILKLAGNSPRVLASEYLKTLPEFDGAVNA